MNAYCALLPVTSSTQVNSTETVEPTEDNKDFWQGAMVPAEDAVKTHVAIHFDGDVVLHYHNISRLIELKAWKGSGDTSPESRWATMTEKVGGWSLFRPNLTRLNRYIADDVCVHVYGQNAHANLNRMLIWSESNANWLRPYDLKTPLIKFMTAAGFVPSERFVDQFGGHAIEFFRGEDRVTLIEDEGKAHVLTFIGEKFTERLWSAPNAELITEYVKCALLAR